MSVEPFPTKNVLLPAAAAAAVEGNFTVWTARWMVPYAVGEVSWNEIIAAYAPLDRVFIHNAGDATFTVRVLSTGVVVTVTALIDRQVPCLWQSMNSALGKYCAHTEDIGGLPNLRIYKDGALQQTLDLSLGIIGWFDLGPDNYIVSMSPDGKYILVENPATAEYALFEGA